MRTQSRARSASSSSCVEKLRSLDRRRQRNAARSDPAILTVHGASPRSTRSRRVASGSFGRTFAPPLHALKSHQRLSEHPIQPTDHRALVSFAAQISARRHLHRGFEADRSADTMSAAGALSPGHDAAERVRRQDQLQGRGHLACVVRRGLNESHSLMAAVGDARRSRSTSMRCVGVPSAFADRCADARSVRCSVQD